MKKKNQVTQETPQRDELVELLANELNKANKDGGKIAYFLDEQENPAEISDWISTGSSILDLAISNRPHGGLPVGKMVSTNHLGVQFDQIGLFIKALSHKLSFKSSQLLRKI